MEANHVNCHSVVQYDVDVERQQERREASLDDGETL